jgi:guanylate kinase
VGVSNQHMIIVVGPSGAGKSSFVDRAIAEMDQLVDIITYTTRGMRAGERPGVPYHFVSMEDFQSKVEKGFFVEYAEVHGNMYGTPIDQIEAAWAEGKAAIMDVDVQGARVLMGRFPQSFSIFIVPPSIDELRKRVLQRDGDTVKNLDLRMKNASIELAQADEFSAQVVNDEFEVAFAEFKKMIEDLLGNG